jgi:hypothetical protein
MVAQLSAFAVMPFEKSMPYHALTGLVVYFHKSLERMSRSTLSVPVITLSACIDLSFSNAISIKLFPLCSWPLRSQRMTEMKRSPSSRTFTAFFTSLMSRNCLSNCSTIYWALRFCFNTSTGVAGPTYFLNTLHS